MEIKSRGKLCLLQGILLFGSEAAFCWRSYGEEVKPTTGKSVGCWAFCRLTQPLQLQRRGGLPYRDRPGRELSRTGSRHIWDNETRRAK